MNNIYWHIINYTHCGMQDVNNNVNNWYIWYTSSTLYVTVINYRKQSWKTDILDWFRTQSIKNYLTTPQQFLQPALQILQKKSDSNKCLGLQMIHPCSACPIDVITMMTSTKFLVAQVETVQMKKGLTCLLYKIRLRNAD